MKVYALFLPQFHFIPENDEWWGKDFTEWRNVKRAQPLYKGHIQPKHPLNGYYYDLSERSTMEWQTSLMKKYHIDGLVYYHYYFNGKKLLEKPAENLLKWKEINQPFFFNWANHTWNRSWNGSKEVLLEQTYGTVENWKEHFSYLLPFFRDTRYIKKDNKPVFMLYDGSFKEKDEMFKCFDEWCKDAGFDGIYLIEECFNGDPESLNDFKKNIASVTQRIYLTEPLVGRKLLINKSKFRKNKNRIINKMTQLGLLKRPCIYQGDAILEAAISNLPIRKEYVHGLFFEWDNTPRHGFRGSVIEPVSKDMFIHYMDTIKDSDFVVVNAWNEWAEGMMMEPTEEYGYRYLEWIRDWKEHKI